MSNCLAKREFLFLLLLLLQTVRPNWTQKKKSWGKKITTVECVWVCESAINSSGQEKSLWLWTLINTACEWSHHDSVCVEEHFNIRDISGTFEDKNMICFCVYVTYFPITCLVSYISHTPLKAGLAVQLWKLQQSLLRLLWNWCLFILCDYSWTTHWSSVATECQYNMENL